MNDFEKCLEQTKTELFNQPIVKEYFHLKEIFQNDLELQKLDQEVRFHQKKMCENQDNDEIYFLEKKLYEEKLKEFNENPIVQNLLEVKQEVFQLLKQAEEVLK